MKAQTENWKRLRQGARETLIAHTQAKMRRQRAGRPPAAKYPQRVLRVVARFKAHTITPPLSRRMGGAWRAAQDPAPPSGPS